jgi:adenosine deaminase
MDVVELAHEFRNEHPCGVVGIDIAAGEEHFGAQQFPQLYEPHYKMIVKAQELEIPIAIHAGETPDGIHNVKRAVAKHKGINNTTFTSEQQSSQDAGVSGIGYGAKRIGHGYRMADSVDLMKQLAKENIHVEICPTSSVETGGWMFDHDMSDYSDMNASIMSHNSQITVNSRGSVIKKKPWKEHPGLKMMEHGIPISLNSDDPAVFHTSLTWQYRIALVKMGLTREQVIQSNINAIEASFGREEEKEKTLAVLRSFHASLSNGETNDNGVGASTRFTDRVRDPFQ